MKLSFFVNVRRRSTGNYIATGRNSQGQIRLRVEVRTGKLFLQKPVKTGGGDHRGIVRAEGNGGMNTSACSSSPISVIFILRFLFADTRPEA